MKNLLSRTQAFILILIEVDNPLSYNVPLLQSITDVFHPDIGLWTIVNFCLILKVFICKMSFHMRTSTLQTFLTFFITTESFLSTIDNLKKLPPEAAVFILIRKGRIKTKLLLVKKLIQYERNILYTQYSFLKFKCDTRQQQIFN